MIPGHVTLSGARSTKSAISSRKGGKLITVRYLINPFPQFNVDGEVIAMEINSIVRQLEGQADGDVPSARVGELVMSALSNLDQVAYVRYASVYRNFREAKDFEAFVEKELGD